MTHRITHFCRVISCWASLDNFLCSKTSFDNSLVNIMRNLVCLFMTLPWVMDYDEACFMHLTPGVVHNFSKAVGV